MIYTTWKLIFAITLSTGAIEETKLSFENAEVCESVYEALSAQGIEAQPCYDYSVWGWDYDPDGYSYD